MAAATPLPERELTALLGRYELGALESYWAAGHGSENSNYFVRVTDDRGSHEVVLTLLEQPPAAPELLVPLLDACDAAGLPIAPIIRNRIGHANDHLLGKSTLLVPRLLGRHVLNPTERHCESVGRFLARFHRIARPLVDRASAHPRDAEWLTKRATEVRPHMPYASADLLDGAVEAVKSLLARQDVAALPRGVLHGDLFRDNVLFTERGLTGVLDFHHASAGHLLYDVAITINDWCTDSSGRVDRDRLRALLRAYHAIRPLTAEERWFVGPFALYAACAFWLSRLATNERNAGSQDVRFKNPEDFRRIVQQHFAHTPYFDIRELELR